MAPPDDDLDQDDDDSTRMGDDGDEGSVADDNRTASGDADASDDESIVESDDVDSDATYTEGDADSDATVAEDQLTLDDAPPRGAVDADGTIVESGDIDENDPPDRTLPIDGIARAASPDDDEDRTLVQPDSIDADREQRFGGDSDATQIEGHDEGDSDRTQGDADDFDATQIQSGDFDATQIESVDSPPASNADFGDDATMVSGDSGPNYTTDKPKPGQQSGTGSGQRSGSGSESRSQFKGRKKKPAHETADRWEAQQRYQLVTNFARGGLGQIWMAQDVRLKREVAFKELLPSALKNSSALERFLEEAQITGQLEHPGIVPIYDIGYQANGTPFYSMKLVRGETMEKYIEQLHELAPNSPERSLQFRKLLRSFIDICNALAFAHDRGVLHRDLKPLNVMIGAFGETLVLDWGLAKIIGCDTLADEQTPLGTSTDSIRGDDATVIETTTATNQATGATNTAGATHVTGATNVTSATGASGATSAAAKKVSKSIDSGKSQRGTLGTTRRHVVTDVRTAGSQTMTGSVMGTPAYMPPEQARGDVDSLDARCDIYSLGGILYKLLTNHQPIGRGKLKQVLEDVKKGNIIPPRKHDPSIDKPLEAVCLKALSTKITDRYDSALQMAADVEAWLADEPVSVFPDPPMVKFKRWRKRHRTAVASSSVAAAAIFVVWVGSAWTHSLNLDAIRADVALHVGHSNDALSAADYSKAKDEINESLGRASSEPDLADLADSLTARLEVIESRRIDDLRRAAEAKLTEAVALIDRDQHADARPLLAELSAMLKGDDKSLPELSSEILKRTQQVENALGAQAAIAETESQFRKFETLVDNARIFGNLEALNPLADDDAKQALQFANDALAVFGFAPPKGANAGNGAAIPAAELTHFSNDLAWTRRSFGQTGRWPIDVVKTARFDMLVAIANLDVYLSRNSEDAAKQNAVVLAAVAKLDQAITLGVGSYAAAATQATMYESIGMQAEARQIVDRLKTQKPSTFQDYFLLGNNERVRLLTESALQNYESALKLNPGDFWTQQYLALCYVRLGHYRAALAYLTNCIAQRPDLAWIRMQRGLCYLAMDDYAAALEEFNNAERTDPKLFHVFINRGATYVKLEDFAKAKADFTKAATIDPRSAMPAMNLASVHLRTATKIRTAADPFRDLDGVARAKQHDLEIQSALDELAKAEKLAPQDPLLFELRGKALERQDKLLEARASYDKSVKFERDPARRCETLKSLAFLDFQASAYDKALVLFQQAHASNLNDAESLFYIAECFLNLKDNPKALQFYNQFLAKLRVDIQTKLSPPELLFNGMALAYSQMPNQPKAVQYYSLALMFKDDHAHSLTRRGWAYALNSFTLAEQDFRDAVKSDPQNADAQIGLAYALVMQQRLPETLQAIDKGVALTTAVIVAESKRQPVNPERIAQYFTLYHNAATVFAQALPLEPDPQKQAELANKSLAILRQAYIVAKVGNKQALMLAYMDRDSSLNPLKKVAKAAFEELFNKLKQDMP